MSKWDSSAGGDSGEVYWSIGRGVAVRNGWTCRECRKPIYKGEDIVSRDGRKIRMMYHSECFSGDADPRTQSGSSINEGRLPEASFSPQAPATKGRGKWSTGSYGYTPDAGAELQASRAGSRVVSRAGSQASSKASSKAVSRGDTAHDRGSDMAGRVVAMAALRLETLAEKQQGGGDDQEEEEEEGGS